MSKGDYKKDPNVCRKKKNCIYGARMGAIFICDYLSLKGEPRPCPVKDCSVYQRGRSKRRALWREKTLTK